LHFFASEVFFGIYRVGHRAINVETAPISTAVSVSHYIAGERDGRFNRSLFIRVILQQVAALQQNELWNVSRVIDLTSNNEN
jgi:hypothetical protein